MNAGRELDALVAKKVMGWKLPDESDLPRTWLMWSEADLGYVWSGWWAQDPEMDEDDNGNSVVRMDYAISGHSAWRPSADIAAAWQVFMHFKDTYKFIAHTQRRSLGWTLGQPLEWQCTIGATNTVKSDTAPHAICLAALRAVGAL